MFFLEEQIAEKLHKRSVKSFMDILILAELENGPMGGYDAIAFIHSKFGVLVSAGTVYSLLHSLERDELIKARIDKRKKIYTLTEKGEKTIKAIRNANNEIQGILKDLLLGK